MHLSVVSSFDYRGSEYWDLYQRSGSTAFQHPVWLKAMQACLLGPEKADFLTVTGRDEDGVLRLVIPLVCRRKFGLRLLEMPDFGVTDYSVPTLCPTLATDRDTLLGLGARLTTELPAHDVLRVSKVRHDHLPVVSSLFAGNWQHHEFSGHATDAYTDHAQWRRESLRPSFSKTLDRKKRSFYKAGEGQLRRLHSSAEIDNAIEFIARIREGRFESDLLQEAEFRKFYASISEEDQQFSEIHALELDGNLVGVVLGLVFKQTFYYLLIGCDYDGYGKFSPGYILYDEIYRRFMEGGGTIFDFTVGDEKFKAQFGAKPVSMHGLLRGNSVLGKGAVAALNAKQAFEARRKGRNTAERS